MRRLVATMLVALVVRFAAPVVIARLDGSERVTPVERGARVARECTCCKAERKSNGKAPRNLITLPRVVTMDKTTFRKPMASVFLCEFCDGEAASEAIKHADKL